MQLQLDTIYSLGETAEEIALETVEENKNAALLLVEQARYSIDIFTQDMDTEIYSHKDFEQCFFNLAKKHPSTKVRILAQDTTTAVKNGHRLVKLAQHITSSVFINTPSAEYKEERSAFLIVDKVGLLHRTSAHNRNYKASLNFMTPQRARKLTEFFNEVWDHSTADIQTRRIYM